MGDYIYEEAELKHKKGLVIHIIVKTIAVKEIANQINIHMVTPLVFDRKPIFPRIRK